VFDGGHPILLVSHDEDGDWQFLDGSDDPQVEDGVIVCLSHVLERGPSIADLADLPTGWIAWRSTADEPWRREQNPWGGDDRNG
jgi:hypothetical protein